MRPVRESVTWPRGVLCVNTRAWGDRVTCRRRRSLRAARAAVSARARRSLARWSRAEGVAESEQIQSAAAAAAQGLHADLARSVCGLCGRVLVVQYRDGNDGGMALRPARGVLEPVQPG